MNNEQHHRTEQIERLLGRVSPANRQNLRAHILVCQTNQGMKVGSIYNFAQAVAHADEAMGGKAFLDATPDDYRAMMTSLGRTYERQGLRVKATCIRKHVRWLYGVDEVAIRYGRVPERYIDLERILHVRRQKAQVVGQVIRDEDFPRLMAALVQPGGKRFPQVVRDHALLAVLRASGFRASEFVSLKLKNVTLEGDLAKLALDNDAKDLKTGPRTIYIRQGVSELRAWLAVHLCAGNPEAHLWVNDRARLTAFSTSSLGKFIRNLMDAADVAKDYAAPVTPHDFRHTCATEKASDPYNWNEPQLCDYFGWAPGSEMPGIYVHLTLEQQRKRILRDAQTLKPDAPQVDATAQLTATVAALTNLLERALGGLASPPMNGQPATAAT